MDGMLDITNGCAAIASDSADLSFFEVLRRCQVWYSNLQTPFQTFMERLEL